MNIFYNCNDVHHLSCTYIDNYNLLTSFFGGDISSPSMRSGWSFHSQHAASLDPRKGHVTKPGPVSGVAGLNGQQTKVLLISLPHYSVPSLSSPAAVLGSSRDTDGSLSPTPMSLLFLSETLLLSGEISLLPHLYSLVPFPKYSTCIKSLVSGSNLLGSFPKTSQTEVQM